jgi:hypothetical protein
MPSLGCSASSVAINAQPAWGGGPASVLTQAGYSFGTENGCAASSGTPMASTRQNIRVSSPHFRIHRKHRSAERFGVCRESLFSTHCGPSPTLRRESLGRPLCIKREWFDVADSTVVIDEPRCRPGRGGGLRGLVGKPLCSGSRRPRARFSRHSCTVPRDASGTGHPDICYSVRGMSRRFGALGNTGAPIFDEGVQL